jgi:hypothetical protein
MIGMTTDTSGLGFRLAALLQFSLAQALERALSWSPVIIVTPTNVFITRFVLISLPPHISLFLFKSRTITDEKFVAPHFQYKVELKKGRNKTLGDD